MYLMVIATTYLFSGLRGNCVRSPEVYVIFVNNMASMKAMDDCVKAYLLHRGLYASAKAVENELKTEKDKAFRVIY